MCLCIKAASKKANHSIFVVYHMISMSWNNRWKMSDFSGPLYVHLFRILLHSLEHTHTLYPWLYPKFTGTIQHWIWSHCSQLYCYSLCAQTLYSHVLWPVMPENDQCIRWSYRYCWSRYNNYWMPSWNVVFDSP